MIKSSTDLASHIEQLVFEQLYFEVENVTDEQVIKYSLIIVKSMMKIETKPKRLGRFLEVQNELKLKLKILKDS